MKMMIRPTSCMNRLLPILLVVPFLPGSCRAEATPAMDTAVFDAETDVVNGHRYECYREPVTVKTRSGRVVVACHAGNRLGWPERSGQDLAVRYSDDGGRTWGPIVVAAEHGNFSVQSHGMVYDAEQDRIMCLYVTYNWDYREAGKGRGVKVTAPIYEKMHAEGKPFLNAYSVFSDDGGETWSVPRDITAMTGGDAHFGASEGRQLTRGPHAGRLLLAGGDDRRMNTQGVVTGKTAGVWISDDHGDSWTFHNVPIPQAVDRPRNISCEARVSELPGNRLIYNVRTRNTGRHLAFSEDGGMTWSEAAKAPGLKAASCNGCTITLRAANGKLTDTLLCSLPSPDGRKDGAVYVSSDGGRTWPLRRPLTSGFFAYSALVQLDAGTVGLFYETGHYRTIRFRRIPVAELVASSDRSELLSSSATMRHGTTFNRNARMGSTDPGGGAWRMYDTVPSP